MCRHASAPPGGAAPLPQLPRAIELPEEWRARLSARLHEAEATAAALVGEGGAAQVREVFGWVKEDIMGLMQLLHHLVNGFAGDSQAVVDEINRRHEEEVAALSAEIGRLSAVPRGASSRRSVSVDLVRPDAAAPRAGPGSSASPAGRGVSMSSGSCCEDAGAGATPGARMPSVSGAASVDLMRGPSIGNPALAAPSPVAWGGHTAGVGSTAAHREESVGDHDITYPFGAAAAGPPVPHPTPVRSAASPSPSARQRSVSAGGLPPVCRQGPPAGRGGVQDMIVSVHPALAGAPVAVQGKAKAKAGGEGRAAAAPPATGGAKGPAAGGDDVFARLTTDGAPKRGGAGRARGSKEAARGPPPAAARPQTPPPNKPLRRLTDDDVWKRNRDRMAQRAARRGFSPPASTRRGSSDAAAAKAAPLHRHRDATKPAREDKRGREGKENDEAPPNPARHAAGKGAAPCVAVQGSRVLAAQHASPQRMAAADEGHVRSYQAVPQQAGGVALMPRSETAAWTSTSVEEAPRTAPSPAPAPFPGLPTERSHSVASYPSCYSSVASAAGFGAGADAPAAPRAAGGGFKSPAPPVATGPPSGGGESRGGPRQGNPLCSPAPSRTARDGGPVDLYQQPEAETEAGAAGEGPRHPLPPGTSFESQYAMVKQREWDARQAQLQQQQQQETEDAGPASLPLEVPLAAAAAPEYGSQRGVLYHSMLQKIRSTYRGPP